MIPLGYPDALVAKLEEARQLITDMMRVINGRMGPMDCPAYDVARRLIGARVNALFALPVSPETPVRMIGSPLRSPASVAADKIAELDVALGVMTQRHDKAMEISEVHARTIERLLRRESELIEKRDRIAGEKSDLKMKVEGLEVKLGRFARWICVHSKHGPNGSGTSGLCEPDCIKCAAEKHSPLRA